MKDTITVIFVLLVFNSVLAENETYTVTSVLEDGYLIDNGNGSFSGFMVDLLDCLSKRAGFSYDLSLTPDGKYGSKNSMGNWDGMIGELLDLNEDVHIAAAPLQITNERQSAVPFTKPFRHIGHRIIIKRPVVEFHSLKVLFEPFALQLWIMVVVICFIVSALLFIVNKFSPSEWGSVQPEDDSTNARESFAPKNAFFFVHSTLTWQGYREAPRSPAGRILVTMWFSFIFFMVIAYISNLTAFLLARQPSSPVVPFKTWEEMTIQSSVNYGVKNGGIMHRLMRESVDSTLKHAIQNIETFGTFFNTDKEGIEMVRKSDGNFAAIVSSDMGNKYVDSEPCDLMYVGATVERTPYGIACKTKTICNSLSSALLSCIEDGSVHLLNVKWFSSLKRCPSYKLKDYVSKQETAKLAARPLTIADTSLAFVVLLLGVILCILFLVIEVVVSRRRSEAATFNGNGDENQGILDDVEQVKLTDKHIADEKEGKSSFAPTVYS